MKVSDEMRIKTEELEQVADKDGVEKKVVGALILSGTNLLILRRAKTEEFLPGLDELPGGGLEEGETLLGALQREVKEETGLSVLSVLEYRGSFDYVSSSRKKTRQFNFLIESNQEDIRLNPREHSGGDWINFIDASSLKKCAFSLEVERIVRQLAIDFKRFGHAV